ncbi:hypothetical protein M9Y10_031357, partial [Tritrichomonas musculus]
MSRPLNIPSETVIKQWKDLNQLPIVDTVQRAVPMTTFLEYPDENALPAVPDTLCRISSKDGYNEMLQFKDLYEEMDQHIHYVYQLRSSTRGLDDALQETQADKNQAADVAKNMLNDILDDFMKARTCCTNAIQAIKTSLSNVSFWTKGLYSDIYLDNLSMLLYKLFSYGQLCPTRSVVSDDFSCLNKLIQKAEGNNTQALPVEIRIWLNSPNQNREELLMELQKMEFADVKTIFYIYFEYICTFFSKHRFIMTDTKYAAIVGFLFMIEFYGYMQNREKGQVAEMEKKDKKKAKKYKIILKPLKDSVIAKYNEIRDKNPFIFIAFELGIEFDSFIKEGKTLVEPQTDKEKSKSQKNQTQTDRVPQSVSQEFLIQLYDQMAKKYDYLATQAALIYTKEQPSQEEIQKFVQTVPSSLRMISYTITSLRELILYKHNHPDETSKKQIYDTDSKSGKSKGRKMERSKSLSGKTKTTEPEAK